MNIRVLHKQRPIKPISFVVLTVSVVVPVLGSANFIAHQEHGKAKREHGDGHEILDLAGSESLNFSIRGWTLDTTVPAPIFIAAVTVFLTIGIVMLLVVRDQVIQRKTIVTGNEVYALLRFALLMPKDLVAAEESVCEDPYCPFVTAEATPHVMAKTSVPF